MAYQINLTGQEIDERLQNIGTAEDVAAADGTLYARISKNADDIDELRDAVGHIDSAQTATDKTVTQHTADISTLQTALKTKANLVLGKVSVNELPVATSLGDPNNGTIPSTFAVSKAISDKIVGLLNWQGVKDTTDEIKDIALAKKGDVWHSNEDGSEWVCTEDIFTADHSVWEELGTPIDLSGYYTKNEVDKKVRIDALDNGDASASFVAGRNLKVNGWEFYWKDVWEESEPSAIKHIESAGVNAAINEIKGTGADVSAFTFPTTKDEFIAYLKTITFDFSNQPNQVSGYGSITYGIMNKNAGTTTIVEGMYNDISNKMHRSHIEGQHMTIPDVEYAVSCHVEGQDCDIVGYASICHLEGNNSAVVHSMGKNVGFFEEAVGCHVEGGGGVVGGAYSHVEGDGCAALNTGAHCEGKGYYKNSVTDWKKRTAKDNDYLKDLWKKILFGKTDTSGYTYKFSAAIGVASHVEGTGNIAPKASVTLEGLDTGTTASFVNGANHAEGAGNLAGAAASHAEGIRNEIGHNAYASHAEGIKNTTQNRAEHASGQYNKSSKATDTFGDAGNTLFSVGCGTSDTDRKNAFEVMQDGTCKYYDVATGEQIDVGVAKELSTPFNLAIGSTTKKVDGKSAVTFTAEEITDKFNGPLIQKLTTASTEADIRKAFTDNGTVKFPTPGSIISKLDGGNKGIVVSLSEPDATTLGRSIVVYYGDGTYTIVVKNDFTKVLVPWRKDSSLRDLYISAGAKYNETTGFYELNGLTDITEEQMRVIYKYAGTPQVKAAFAYSKARTNLPMPGMYNGSLYDQMFFNCSALEIVNLGYRQAPAMLTSNIIEVLGGTPFVGCRKLHTIYGILISYNPSFNWSGIFDDCTALKEVRIKQLQTSIPLSASLNLSKESVLYMITNANPPSGAAAGSIAITLHPTAYARLKDDADIVAALEAKGGIVTLVSA
uniref:Uncharacterized protein n=1 Tax=Siphoviridae sp. ctCeQ13 TaxID=2825380 RepID=A0A8S5PAK3_9CAUD|nr:MAG TPA: hypothetical protein [Siphoviridae sp. ctCeQ13]